MSFSNIVRIDKGCNKLKNRRITKKKINFMSKCEFEIGEKVTPLYDSARKGQVGTIINIENYEDVDCDGLGREITSNVYYVDVQFSDGVIAYYRDCRLRKVKESDY